ncbi:MAG: SIMPL domain-containing protein [Patescibacteria group bacterium]
MSTNNEKFELSNRLYSVILVFVVGIIAFWGFRAYEIWNADPTNYPREITVEGIGKSYVVPDIAKISLGVNTKGKTSEATMSDNTKKINAIMSELEKLGIDKKDIKTTNFYLNPNYVYQPTTGESKQDGYILDQNIEVTVRDFEKTGDVISKSTSAGANMVGGINFTIEDRESAKTKAREEAITKAKLKAEMIEEQTGLRLGKIVNFYEYENGGDYYGKGGYSETMAMDTGAAVSPDVQPGEQEVSLTVSLTYRLK